MQKVVTPQQMKTIDEYFINRIRIPGIVLMENAAIAVANEIMQHVQNATKGVLILCGGGNNGGDGLALLRQLAMRDIPAYALLFADEADLPPDARTNFDAANRAMLNIEKAQDEASVKAAFYRKPGIVVDALFGTGIHRDIEGLSKTAILYANNLNALKLAVDIPSGVDGKTGKIFGCAFKADITVTFQHIKRGHLLFPGRDYTGRLVIGKISPELNENINESLLEESDIKRMLPERDANSHKGTYGKALLIAGSDGLGGAAKLAANAALRAGCGLLRLALTEPVLKLFADLPEAMANAVAAENWESTDFKKLDALIENSTCIAIGPGMGRKNGAAQVVSYVLKFELPAVIDADGLNALAEFDIVKLSSNVVLTPHPAEMARLLKCTVDEVLNDPLNTAINAANEWGCTVLLKGATSIIAAPNGRVTYNTSGNAGLSKGGSGDVLTGIILSLLAQGLSAYDSARVGAYLLGASADKALGLLGNRAMLARDVISALTDVIN